MPSPPDASGLPDVLVVGGGVAGLGVAWRLASRGLGVEVLERGEAGRGASWAAAGMLAPSLEIGFEEMDLYRLSRESLARWPAFAREVEEASGLRVGYRGEGTLDVATDRDEAAALRRRFRFQQEQGVPAEWLDADEAQEIEPLLAPGLPGAVWAPGDHQVDARALTRALAEASRRAGAVFREGVEVARIEAGEVSPSVVLSDGTRRGARAVVLAAGAWVRGVGGLEGGATPIRPVKSKGPTRRPSARSKARASPSAWSPRSS